MEKLLNVNLKSVENATLLKAAFELKLLRRVETKTKRDKGKTKTPYSNSSIRERSCKLRQLKGVLNALSKMLKELLLYGDAMRVNNK